MGLADEVESPSRRLSPTLPLTRTLTRTLTLKVERLTRDPGAKYEPRAVLALLATDPPPPSEPSESPLLISTPCLLISITRRTRAERLANGLVHGLAQA